MTGGEPGERVGTTADGPRGSTECGDRAGEERASVYLIELRDLYRVVEVLGDTAGAMIGGEVTERVRDVLGPDAAVGRAGSAQYVTVAPAGDDEEARQLGVRIREALRGELEIPGGGVTFSVAVSVVTVPVGVSVATSDSGMNQRARAGLRAARGSSDGLFLASD